MSKLLDAFSEYDGGTEKSPQILSGILGLPIGGNLTVQVPNRPGYVFVRIRDTQNEFVSAYNDEVSPVYNLPVLIQRQGNRWRVVDRDLERYENWGTNLPFLPKHGDQHSFNRAGGGGDVVWVYADQFMPLLTTPSGTSGGPNVLLDSYLLQRDSDFIHVGFTGSPNMVQYKPTNNQAIMGLVYLNRQSGNMGLLINSGSPFNANMTGTAEIAPYIPYPAAYQEPLYAFRLVSGTQTIQWENLYNARQFYSGKVTGTGGGGSSTFLGLSDTPNSYAGFSGQFVAVNGTETGLEFIASAPGAFTVDGLPYRTDAGDLPYSILEDDDEFAIAESTDSFLDKKINSQDLFGYLGSPNEYNEWFFPSDENGWTLGANWSWSGGVLMHTPGAEDSVYINIPLKAAGWWYRLYVEIDPYTDGYLYAFIDGETVLFNGSSQFRNGGNYGEARFLNTGVNNTIEIFGSSNFDGSIYTIYIERINIVPEVPEPTSSWTYGRSPFWGWRRVAEEAPIDGEYYVRRNSTWEILPTGTAIHEPVTLLEPANGLGLSIQQLSMDLASSTSTGTLSAADWTTFNSKLDDAPSDGVLYGRKDAAWSPVTGTGGGAIASGTYVPGILTPNRIVVTSPVGFVETDPQLYWDEDSNVMIVGAATVPVTGRDSVHVVGSGTGPTIAGWSGESGTSATAGMAFFGGFRGRGPLSSPSGIFKNMGLVRFIGRGHDGSAWSNTQAQMLLVADEDWNSSKHGAGLGFYATPTGTTTQREVAHLYGDGNLDLTQSGTYNVNGVPHHHGSIILYPSHALTNGVPASSTYFVCPFVDGAPIATERAMVVTRAGVVKNLLVRMNGTQPASGNMQISIFKNSSTALITVTVPAGATVATFSDTTSKVAVAAGDFLSFRIINNATTTSGTLGFMAFEVVVDTDL